MGGGDKYSDIGKESYGDILKKFETRGELIYSSFQKETVMMKELIEASFNLHVIVEDKINEIREETGERPRGSEQLPRVFFHSNNHYLMSSYMLTLKGLMNPPYLLLRAVFEKILQSYMVYLADEEAELFYKSEIKDLTTEEKRKVKKDYRNFRPAFIRKLLYTGEKLDSMDELYREFSKTAHPVIEHAFIDAIYDEVNFKDNFNVTILLACANIMAFTEICSDFIETPVGEKIEELIKRVSFEVGNYPDLLPNKAEYESKLKSKFYDLSD